MLQYLTDQSRRERLAGTTRQSGTVGIKADYNKDARQATVTITPVDGAKMLGYEISRELNGKTEAVAFLSARSGETSWNDPLGSVNNKPVTYSVKAVDILGYVIAEAQAQQLQISHDNIIPREEYQWSQENGGLVATFEEPRSVAAIRFTTTNAATADADAVAASKSPVINGEGLQLQIGDTSESYNQLSVKIGDMHTKALGIDTLSIADPEGASAAIQTIRDAINQVSSVRGDLGATQNRLEHTANNLSVMAENIQDAESTIRDTDIAEEMMSYTKNNILVQSAQAMLAQANQVPQGVLQLLG